MTRTIDPAQRRKMEEGKRRAKARKRRESTEKVETYRKWVKADARWWELGKIGSRPIMPAVPSDADYKRMRGEEDED